MPCACPRPVRREGRRRVMRIETWEEKMTRVVQTLCLSLFGAMALTGCGNSLADRMDLLLDPDNNFAKVEVEMSDGLEVRLDGSFDIANGYGNLTFEPATRRDNAKIVLEFDLLRVAEDQLGTTQLVTELPNNAGPLPVAMTPPLIGIDVMENRDFDVDALVSVVPELQAGALVGIDKFRSRYIPQGASICQNFRNSDGLAVAALCVYGPGDESGGIFIGGNFGDVFNLDESPSDDSNLMAMSSFTALNRSTIDEQLTIKDHVRSFAVSSYSWDEERHDPRRKLRGSKGKRAMDNVKKILRVRR